MITAIRKAPRKNLYYLYITKRYGALASVLSMRDLLLEKPSDPIAPLVQREVLSVPATMPREEVVNLDVGAKISGAAGQDGNTGS